uniref:Autophagy-related protein 22-1 n=2 Tax=Anthurium amnicola TaxID=1678845 RepID=A0A1D1ZHT9_9ARAE
MASLLSSRKLPSFQEGFPMGRSNSSDISSSKAVLLGALSSGVNGPTWLVLKIIFLLLATCLAAMLVLAFLSSDAVIAGHVILLVIICGVLFILLNSFLSQTGLVSVEQQMEEMGILHKEDAEEKKN